MRQPAYKPALQFGSEYSIRWGARTPDGPIVSIGARCCLEVGAAGLGFLAYYGPGILAAPLQRQYPDQPFTNRAIRGSHNNNCR